MNEITLKESWNGHRKGVVLAVVHPRQEMPGKPCVDVVRAQSMVDKGIALSGRKVRKAKED